MGILASTMANCLAGDGSRTFVPADFIPKLEAKSDLASGGMSDEQMNAHFDLMKARFENVALPEVTSAK